MEPWFKVRSWHMCDTGSYPAPVTDICVTLCKTLGLSVLSFSSIKEGYFFRSFLVASCRETSSNQLNQANFGLFTDLKSRGAMPLGDLMAFCIRPVLFILRFTSWWKRRGQGRWQAPCGPDPEGENAFVSASLRSHLEPPPWPEVEPTDRLCCGLSQVPGLDLRVRQPPPQSHWDSANRHWGP